MKHTANYTFIFYMKLLTDCANQSESKYIIDSGTSIFADKISLFVEDDRLTFRIYDRAGIAYSCSYNAGKYQNNFGLLICEITSNDNNSIISLSSDSEVLATETATFPIIFNSSPIEANYFIGASTSGNNFGCMEIAQQLVYAKSLIPNEREKIVQYFKSKYSSESFSRIQIKNGSFLYRNVDGNLIQPNQGQQPKFFNS